MDENLTGAVTETAADTGAAEQPITGDELYEKYENGASIEELNAMLDGGMEKEPDGAEPEQSPEDGAKETDAAQETTATPEQPVQQQQKQERTFTQKDVDYFIGKRIGEEQRKQAGLLDDLAAILGVESGKVAEAIHRQRLEAEAESKGIQDKELYARAKQLEQQQAEMQRQQAENAAFRSKIADLQQQGKASGVDIVALSQNDAFVGMVNSLYRDPATRGNAVKLAYNAVFFDDVVKKAAETEREKVISTVRAGQLRVEEGASGGSAGAASKVDVARLSDDQIAKIAEQVMNGEKIVF